MANDNAPGQVVIAGTATGINANGAEAPDLPLVFEPGEGWIYGVGIDWAGKLVEAVSGEAFDATLRRRAASAGQSLQESSLIS